MYIVVLVVPVFPEFVGVLVIHLSCDLRLARQHHLSRQPRSKCELKVSDILDIQLGCTHSASSEVSH